MSVSSYAIANKFIELAQKEGKLLTNMQLQKLVIIAHGYTLALLDRPLYDEKTYAWQWGPVVKKLYKSLQKYGRDFVTKQISTDDKLSDDSEEMEIVSAVWRTYGHFTGSQLSALTHKPNTPWSIIWKHEPFGVIPDPLISEHYKNAIERAQAKEQS
jgi:uncharacterized phage-associated protein